MSKKNSDFCIFLFVIILLFFSSCVVNPAQEISIRKNRAYLFKSITLEILPTDQVDLQPKAISAFVDKLDRYSFCKRDRIRIVWHKDLIVARDKWKSRHLDRLVKNNRQHHDVNYQDRHLVLFIAVLPGHYAQDDDLESVAGLQRKQDLIFIFRNRSVKSNVQILLHEFGHVLNMVNRDKRKGNPVNPDRPNHCNNPDCVMFWTVTTPYFCDLCIRDISELAGSI